MPETTNTTTDQPTSTTTEPTPDITEEQTMEIKGLKEVNDDNYKKILEGKFNTAPGHAYDDGTETVDVITEYYWIQNKPKETGSNNLAPVPFLYATEYKQKYGVTATNLFNNVLALSNMSGTISNGVDNGVKSAFDKLKETLNSALGDGGSTVRGFERGWKDQKKMIIDLGDAINDTEFSKMISEWGQGVSKIFSELCQAAWSGNGYLNTDLLSPYFHLYSLEATKKKFCFPYFADGGAQWSIANSFGDGGAAGLLSKGISGAIDGLVTGLISFAADFQDVTTFFTKGSDSSGFTMYNVEKAKAFSFPSDGKSVKVRFPLFNTVKKDEWKKNYRFIVLFGTRNMLFRKNNVQYYPPLFYDVCTPGYGRMPLTYVKSFTVKPVGMTRLMSIDFSELGLGDITWKNTKSEKIESTSVIVPEAWVVDIEFQSLIADSANQYLSSIFDLPIQASVVKWK